MAAIFMAFSHCNLEPMHRQLWQRIDHSWFWTPAHSMRNSLLHFVSERLTLLHIYICFFLVSIAFRVNKNKDRDTGTFPKKLCSLIELSEIQDSVRFSDILSTGFLVVFFALNHLKFSVKVSWTDIMYMYKGSHTLLLFQNDGILIENSGISQSK